MDVNGCDTSREARLGGVKNIEQSEAQSPKPIQSSKSMGRGCGPMRDNARKGYARENASFDPGNYFIQSLPGQFHNDKGDALSLISDEAALLLRGVGSFITK